MTVGEIYYDRASDRAKLVQAETAANRALIRGHSLEQALWLHGSGRDRLGGVGHGEQGYYPLSTMNCGMTEAQYQDFKQNILPKVLAGSDEAKGFTGNASADVADRQRAKNTPVFDLGMKAAINTSMKVRSGMSCRAGTGGTTSAGVDNKPITPVTRLMPGTPRKAEPTFATRTGGGSDLSSQVQRGRANLFSSGRAAREGIPGGIASNLTTITSPNGTKLQVNAGAAPHFKAFMDELAAGRLQDIRCEQFKRQAKARRWRHV